MASGERRDSVGVLALVLGSLLLLLGGVFVLVYLARLVTGDGDVTDNVSGFVTLTAITVGPGVLLVHRGRRDQPARASPSQPNEDALVELRRSERSNRAQFWRHVGIMSALALGSMVVLLVAGVALGLPPIVPGLIAAAGAGLTIAVLNNRASKPTGPMDAEPRLENAPVRFSNIAFSERRPTMLGWKRDIGVLTIQTESIVIKGLAGHRVVIKAPYAAELHREKYMHWKMVRLTGGESEDARTVYLVVRGAPRSRFAANPQEIARESIQLVTAINDTSPLSR